MCNQAVDNYTHALKFVPYCYKTQEMCDKVANTYFFVFHSVPGWYEVQEMCNRVVYEDPFKLKYRSDRYKFQKMQDEAIDNKIC